MVTIPNFPFLCGSKSIVEGLPHGVTGMAALGRSYLSLLSLFASMISSFPKKFTICLSSSTSAKGAISFSNSPYRFLPNIDVSKSLTYTPLLKNPMGSSPGEPSVEYSIGVQSIRVGGKRVDLNTTFLSINKKGFGGAKISTVNPYTVMEISLYKAMTEAFTETLGGGIMKVTPIAPF